MSHVDPDATRELGEAACTLSGVLCAVQDHFGEDAQVWFRGQHDAAFGLIPSIFRQGAPPWPQSLDEAAMIREFMRVHADHRQTHVSQDEWLTLMQHYGLPTRVLDWSTNVLAGLHFAVEEPRDQDPTAGALYVLDPRVLDVDPYTDEIGWAGQWQGNSRIERLRDALVYARTKEEVIHQLIEHFCEELLQREHGVEGHHGLMLELRCERAPLKIGPVRILGGRAPQIAHRLAQADLSRLCRLREVLAYKVDLRDEAYPPILGQTPVWMLSLYPEPDVSVERHESLVRTLQVPRRLEVPHLNARIRAQHGQFTRHGGKYIGGEPVIAFYPPEQLWGERVIKLVIPHAHKAKLRRELRYAGVAPDTLFPEMEHRARAIRDRHTMRRE